MQYKTPNVAGAEALLSHFAERGVSLTVEYVREPDNTHWWRVWQRGGQRMPGDFEAIGRFKSELVEILRARGDFEPKNISMQRRRSKRRTSIWHGASIPPVYRGLLADLWRPNGVAD